MNAAKLAADELELGRLGEFFGFHLRLAQLRAFSHFPSTGAMSDFTPALFSTLLLIEANPGVKQAALAGVLQVDRSTIVRMIDRLEEGGLVRRGTSRRDRRAAPPLVTARGREFLNEAVRRTQRGQEAVVERLTMKERATLLDLLRKLNALG
jgi:DNA-binding MarR family transcriptional regulator